MNNARPICPGVPSLASGWSLELQACGVRKLTSEEAAMLHTVKEDLNYICGGPIFPSGHELETKIGVRSDLSCANEVASQYYACKRGFPTVCYHCVSKDPPTCFAGYEESLPVRASCLHPMLATRYTSAHTR